VKKILPVLLLCAMFLMSCAAKKTAIVDSTIAEAKILQALAKSNGLDTPVSADSLITVAEQQNEDGKTESALVFADEAVLQFQLALQKQENKKMTDSLKVLEERKSAVRK